MKKNNLLGSVILVNVFQLILCCIINVLVEKNIFNNQITLISVFVIENLIWFIFGNLYASKQKERKIYKAFSYGIIAILPIALLTAIGFVLNIYSDPSVGNWTEYFFLGAPLNFWHKPIYCLVNYFNNIYLLYLANIASLFLISAIGVIYKYIVKIIRNNKRKKRNISKQNEETATDDLVDSDKETDETEDVKNDKETKETNEIENSVEDDSSTEKVSLLINTDNIMDNKQENENNI